jgi:pimeloyl-[acyl-carrier protein] methyl ester esterase
MSRPPLHVECAGAGRPLVLLHGWALHAGLFAPLLPRLATTHRVHAVDLPGHGRSAGVPVASLDGIVAALDAAFAAEPPPLDVLGWSFGGTVALAWAHRHPQRVRRLVLVAATPKFVADDSWPHGMDATTFARFADELRVAYQPTLQRFATLQVQGSEAARPTLAALRDALFARGAPDPALLSGALYTLGATDLRGLVPAIAQPALVVTGDRDTLVPAGASRWLADALPHARLHRIEGAAHAPFLSHPDALVAATSRFLAEVP